MKVCKEETVKLFSVSQKNEKQQTQVGAWKILSIKKKGGRMSYNSDQILLYVA